MALQERNLKLPESFIPDADFAEQIGKANGIDAESALEWLAEEFSMLPFGLPRTTCSTRAEGVFRRLAQGPTVEDAWMPFGTVGPLVLFAHFNPVCPDTWNVPDELSVKVLVPQLQYQALQQDVLGRIGFKPLDRESPLQLKSALADGASLGNALEWLLANYPFEEEEAEKLRDAADSVKAISNPTPEDLKDIPASYVLALEHLSTGERCFNPNHAPSQTHFQDSLLEKHLVYPLYIGRKHVYMLSHKRENFAFEDEWLSSGQETLPCRWVLAEREAILNAISRNRGRSVRDAKSAVVGDLTYSDAANIVDIDVVEMQRINPSSINTTPEQVVHWVLNRSIAGRASDLHIEKYFNMARFRARIDGELKVIHSCPEELLARFVSLIKNYSNMGQQRQDAQDARFSMIIGQRRIDCRVSAIPCRKDQQKITIRFLDKRDGVRKLSELNLGPRQLEIISETMGRDQGLALITGPTGSGKTTTLYAMLNSINAENINIHTIEDPIEYEIEGINQTQTDPINNINFAEGLRRLLRADPDVILIGECRDEETASAAVNAALTGHLVLTTLHANDCLRAVSRLLAMGIPPYLLADALALSQAQRLVRRLCAYCKRPQPITPEVRAIFEGNRIPIPPSVNHIYEKSGCSECSETGYTGRMALMELCPIDSKLSDLVSINAPQSQMREIAFQRGVLTLYQEGLQQVLAGATSLDEISCLSYTAFSTAHIHNHGDTPGSEAEPATAAAVAD